MATNKEKIEKIYKLEEELQKLLEKESDLYKKATDNREKKLKIKRGDEKVEVTEGELWEEVRITGAQGEAAKKLKKKYPKVFKAAEKREAKNIELHDHIMKEFGFSFRQMNIANYMKLTEAMIDYKLGK